MTVEQLTGKCLEASKAAKRGNLRAAAGFHASCRGRWYSRPGLPVVECSCPCHVTHEPKDIVAVVAKEKTERRAKVGIVKKPTRRKGGLCGKRHRMLPANTGPRGECIKCKRASAAKSRAKARLKKAAEKEAGTP